MSKNKKMYALVGSWFYRPGQKGITVYKYNPENGSLELIESGFSDVNACHVSLDPERNIAYFTDTCGDRRGEIGGGGYVIAFRVDPETGKLTMISKKESLAPEPEYICVDNTKRYAMIPHHTDSGHVTRIVKKADGSFTSETLLDDAAVVLFRLNEDGTFGEVCDVSITRGEGSAVGPHVYSQLHSVVADPTGELFAVCDKGTDKIHTYHLDRKKGKLIPLQATAVETGISPRFSTFHPTIPVYYVNFERKPIVHTYRYDVATGKLDRIGVTSLLLDEKAAEGVHAWDIADILLHPNGKHLYVTVRGIESIAVLDVDDKGMLTLKQNINCGGKWPRCLCFSPDTRFLFTTNTESNNIVKFALGADGTLSATGQQTESRLAACMKILVVK
jgi:6-phosphogluconolactonase